MFGFGSAELLLTIAPLILGCVLLYGLLGVLHRFVKAYQERTRVLREKRTDS